MEEEASKAMDDGSWLERLDTAVKCARLPEAKTPSAQDNGTLDVWEKQLDLYASQKATNSLPPARLTTIPIPRSRRPVLTRIQRTAERLLCFTFLGSIAQFACGIREAAMRRIALCLCLVVLSFASIFGGIRTVWNCSQGSVVLLAFLLVFDVVVCVAIIIPRVVKAVMVAGVLPPGGCRYHVVDNIMAESLSDGSCRQFILHSTIINGGLFILTALLFAIAAGCCAVLFRQVNRWKRLAGQAGIGQHPSSAEKH